MMLMSDKPPSGMQSAFDQGRTRYITEESVYGVVLASGLIAVSGAHGEDPWGIFVSVVITVVVFWAVHVYAGTVAAQASRPGSPLRDDVRHAVVRSRGLLLGALVPSVILLFGALRVVDDELAIWAALWIDVLLLGAVGYLAFAQTGSSWIVRVVGTLVTGSFGIAMILLKAFIH
jgi:hypothetical protein